jgi:lipoprotein-releasing system permease protein
MLFLAFKQLRARPRQTILTFIAIVLGSTAYVVFSGLMLGFQDKILDSLINTDAHVKISPRDDLITGETFRDVFFTEGGLQWAVHPSGKTDSTKLGRAQLWFQRLEQDPRVAAYAPQLSRQVIFVRGRFSVPGNLIGIVPSKQKRVTNIDQNVTEGKMDDLSRGGALVIVGGELLRKLGGRVGDTIRIVSPNGQSSPVRVIGTFRAGNRMIEGALCYASIETTQAVTASQGQVSVIGIKLKELSQSEPVAQEWASLSNDKVESWEKANESLLTVFFTQDLVRNITTLTIILVVSFGIYNILNMVVNQKKREIAILRSMGYSSRDIEVLFLYQGVLLGFVGAGLGLGIGYLICVYLSTIELPGNIATGLNHLLISFKPIIYVRAFAISSGSSLLASFFPARAAGKLAPIEVIRQS